MFRGAAEPLLGCPVDAAGFHGADGLGDAPDPHAPGLEMLQKEGAVEAMIRIVNQHHGEVGTMSVHIAQGRHVPPTYY